MSGGSKNRVSLVGMAGGRVEIGRKYRFGANIFRASKRERKKEKKNGFYIWPTNFQNPDYLNENFPKNSDSVQELSVRV